MCADACRRLPGWHGAGQVKELHPAIEYRVAIVTPIANADDKHIMPGETLEVADITGAGMITHIWVDCDAE